jgi:uncharacterized protein YndB with AHSA1/START domain
MIQPVSKSIEVSCDPATAFEIFTKRIAQWWPLDGHSVSAMNGQTAKSLTLEPGRGGLLYEITADGNREDWGSVQIWEPGKRLLLKWRVMAPESQATQVDIQFTRTREGTRVDLVHSGWEILGEGAQERRDSYSKGWVRVFETCFANACAA